MLSITHQVSLYKNTIRTILRMRYCLNLLLWNNSFNCFSNQMKIPCHGLSISSQINKLIPPLYTGYLNISIYELFDLLQDKLYLPFLFMNNMYIFCIHTHIPTYHVCLYITACICFTLWYNTLSNILFMVLKSLMLSTSVVVLANPYLSTYCIQCFTDII